MNVRERSIEVFLQRRTERTCSPLVRLSCTSKNPFDFVKAFGPQIQSTINQTNNALDAIDKLGLDQVSLICGADISPLVSGMQRLVESLHVAQENIQFALEVSDRAAITPILDGLLHGAICDESVTGLVGVDV
jgi:hypothetical protein